MMDELEFIEQASNADLADVGADAAARSVGRIVQECGEFDTLDSSERELLNRALLALDRIEAVDTTSDTPTLVRMMALGKLGEFGRAIDEGKRTYDARPSWNSAITLANALQRAGRLEDAIEMWTTAAELDPDDVTALLQVGDAHIFLEEWDAAIRAYERVTQREADQAWAVPSIHYCQYRLTGQKKWLQRVKRRAAKDPDECGVESMLAQITGSYAPDVGIQRAQQLLEIDRESRSH